MRPFELLLFSVLFLYALSIFVRREKRSRWLHLMPGLSLLIVLIHIVIEGQRWQMVPLYLYVVLLSAFTFRNIRLVRQSADKPVSKGSGLLRITGGVSSILLLAVLSTPPLLVPVFELPGPTGPYEVGTRYDYFVDTSRPELLTPDTTDFQELSVRVWYPADRPGDAAPVPYWESAGLQSEIISKFWGGLPGFLFNHFSLVETHSYRDAPLSEAEERYPVLIFNHGSLGLPSLNTVLMEELASNGFIIFAIGHSDYIPFFIRPDGTIKAFDPNAEGLQAKMRENNDPEVKSIADRLMESRDVCEQEMLLRRFLEKNPENQKSLFRWAEDISFAVSELETLQNGNGFFAGRLDLDRIGVFGVSFGGAASVQACVRDDRCKAAISMDCPQFGDVLDNELSQPIMYMSSEQYRGMNDIFFEVKNNPLTMVTIKNTTHQNFSDVSIWGTLFQMQMLGRIDGERCLQIQNRYICAFFEKYLKSIDNKLLSGASAEYPEVDIRVKNIG